MADHTAAATRVPWMSLIAPYQVPDTHKAVWQICNSFLPFFACWAAMVLSLRVHYALTWLLCVPTIGLFVRIFIIQHDCGHGSFFGSRRANDVLGFICGIVTLVPYYQWRKSHAIHHATTSHLERRGVGDVWTLTVSEYLRASRWGRFAYRFYRHPLFLFLIAPTLQLVILHRIPWNRQTAWSRERASVLWTNVLLIALYAVLGSLLGWRVLLMVQLPLVALVGAAGMWLFYVQHQFEDTYWARDAEWDYETAAMRGSSYFKLPRLLQWFSGNIGFHHIHHLSHRIPNYNLQRCHDSTSALQPTRTLTIRSSLRTLQLRFWDEQRNRLVGTRRMRVLQRRRATALTARTVRRRTKNFCSTG